MADGARDLQAASWTGIYAAGISEVNALDAEHKFQRLGMRCQALLGARQQEMHAESAHQGEVALIFRSQAAPDHWLRLPRLRGWAARGLFQSPPPIARWRTPLMW